MTQSETVEGDQQGQGPATLTHNVPLDARERIRAEEIFRQEVRNDLERARKVKPSLLNILNTPIIIWALSTLVVGTVSFIYTLSIEAREARAISTRQQRIVMDEVKFRARQTDTALAAPITVGDALLLEIAAGAGIAPQSIRDYVAGVGGAAVVLRLGGLIAFADGRESSAVWIGTAGYGVRHLPFGRPFKNPDLQHHSLVDLAAEHHRLRDGDGDPARDPRVQDLVEQLDRLSRSVPHNALDRLEAAIRTQGDIAIEPDQARALNADLQRLQTWLLQAREVWASFDGELSTFAVAVP